MTQGKVKRWNVGNSRDRSQSEARAVGSAAPRLAVRCCHLKYASLIDGLKYGFLDDPVFERVVDRDLKEGQHRNPTGGKDYFTTAFFHHPHELAQEVKKSGYSLKGIYAVEGPAEILSGQDLNKRLGDETARRRILRFLETVEQEPSLLGLSSHLLAVGTSNKPADSP